eukprot:IDg9359t1
MASLAVALRSRYSAPAEDCATHPCFLDFQLTAPPHILKAKPLVDFLLEGLSWRFNELCEPAYRKSDVGPRAFKQIHFASNALPEESIVNQVTVKVSWSELGLHRRNDRPTFAHAEAIKDFGSVSCLT